MKYRLLVMDVDGTLTDGRLYIGNSGEIMKAFDVRDGYGIVRFRQCGGIPAIITGRRSEIVERRCVELGITELHQGAEDKLSTLREMAERLKIRREEIAYIGDDENDIDCMEYAGFSACPRDAAESVRRGVDYVCSADGGRGAVRELINHILSACAPHE